MGTFTRKISQFYERKISQFYRRKIIRLVMKIDSEEFLSKIYSFLLKQIESK